MTPQTNFFEAATATLQLLLTFALLAISGLSAAGSTAAAVGQVSLIIGDARVTRLDGSQIQLRQGNDVFVGDRVQTGANGHVHLRFVDRGAVSVRPDSVLEVQAYTFDPSHPQSNEVRLRIENGTARSISGAATEADKSRFRLNTPIAAIGVRGTDFIVQASSDQVRAVVAQGAITVAPLGAGCTAASLGPCSGDQARLLSADMGRMMVEVRAGEGTARLATATAALLPPLHLADAAVRERANGEATARATALASTQPAGDRFANDTTTADLLAISPVGQTDARKLVTKPDSNAQLVWGRWSFARPQFDNISATFSVASNGREVTVGDLDGALFRAGTRTSFDDPGSKPEAGRVDLRLTRAQAGYEINGKIETASVEGGTLALDFGKRTFATALAMSAANTGRVELRAGGVIDNNGTFNVRDAEQKVSGAVSFDGKEAGYLFERAAGNGVFKGRTLWGKGP